MFSKGKEFDHYTLQNQSKVTKEDLFGVNIPKNYHKYSFTLDSSRIKVQKTCLYILTA
jgi:hypothetical protein